MGRRGRRDEVGALHHVVNRGIAKRPLFEDRDDIRFFLSRLAREVRRGRLEILAFSILTTHFHALVRSPSAELSESMQLAQNEYARRFNRRHRRDGPLVRGRFFSRRVDSSEYLETLVRYIDHNAVRAGLCRHPAQYQFGSAFLYGRTRKTPWLAREGLEAHACRRTGETTFTMATYDRVFGEALPEGVWEVIERSSFFDRANTDIGREFTDLVGQTSEYVRSWLLRKASLADGNEPGVLVVDPGSLREAVSKFETLIESWQSSQRAKNGRQPSANVIVICGLGRSLAGLTWSELSVLAGSSETNASRAARRHFALLGTDEIYAKLAADVASTALRLCHGR